MGFFDEAKDGGVREGGFVELLEEVDAEEDGKETEINFSEDESVGGWG